jgi:hypothetical protein
VLPEEFHESANQVFECDPQEWLEHFAVVLRDTVESSSQQQSTQKSQSQARNFITWCSTPVEPEIQLTLTKAGPVMPYVDIAQMEMHIHICLLCIYANCSNIFTCAKAKETIAVLLF